MFAVAALVLFGWAPATFVYATAPTLVALGRRNPFIRTIFNAGVFGLTGVLAGWVLTQFDGDSSTASILLRVAVTARDPVHRQPRTRQRSDRSVGLRDRLLQARRSNARWLALPFTLMASTALMLVVLWQRTPYLIAALVGPLAAISLYQRSTHQALKAMRLALTDPLTGLGNHRNFQERLQRELTRAEETRGLVSVCLLDIDDFKRINDQHGHPAGDKVLAQVSTRLRQGGEAFRLGGDEFALLLPSLDDDAALERRAVGGQARR